jgi:uncharacterized repeat protein (TIGR03803 family)
MFQISGVPLISVCLLVAVTLIPWHGASAKGFRVIYTFQSLQDGAAPHAGLIKDDAGNFYGTTFYGGDTQLGQGTAFKLVPDGTKTVLHAFSGGTDGGLPAELGRSSQRREADSSARRSVAETGISAPSSS